MYCHEVSTATFIFFRFGNRVYYLQLYYTEIFLSFSFNCITIFYNDVRLTKKPSKRSGRVCVAPPRPQEPTVMSMMNPMNTFAFHLIVS